MSFLARSTGQKTVVKTGRDDVKVSIDSSLPVSFRQADIVRAVPGVVSQIPPGDELYPIIFSRRCFRSSNTVSIPCGKALWIDLRGVRATATAKVAVLKVQLPLRG